MKEKEPLISIVIPVKNGVDTLADCLEAIEKQSLYKQCEIIVIDSGSTDGTLALLKDYEVKLIQIQPENFNHGATRNLGVRQAKGEFVVMLVQDAAAVDEYWLEKMLRHFNNTEIAGVCGQQIVPHRKDVNPHQWFRPQSEPSLKTYQFSIKKEYLELSPLEMRKCCSWDNVNAMYRKSVMEKLPFRHVIFGEDMLWAQEALLEGYRLVYDTASRVSHYHHHFPDYTYKRTLIEWLFIYKNFRLVKDMPYSLRDYIAVVYRNFKWKLHPKWIFFNWSLMQSKQKAVMHFRTALKNHKIDQLEIQFKLNIPQGKSKTSN